MLLIYLMMLRLVMENNCWMTSCCFLLVHFFDWLSNICPQIHPSRFPFLLEIIFTSIVPPLILFLLSCQISARTFCNFNVHPFLFLFFPLVLFCSISHLNWRFSFAVKCPFCPSFFRSLFFLGLNPFLFHIPLYWIFLFHCICDNSSVDTSISHLRVYYYQLFPVL